MTKLEQEERGHFSFVYFLLKQNDAWRVVITPTNSGSYTLRTRKILGNVADEAQL